MTPTTPYEIQTHNVRELNKAWKQTTMLINESYRTKNFQAVDIQTKLLALLFSAYTEAIFSKLIHTPYALNSSEIDTLKTKFRNESFAGWKHCLNTMVAKISSKTEIEKENIRSDMLLILRDYIRQPSELRNRLAHGQWSIAMNRANTQENAQITQRIADLDVVKLEVYKKSFDLMSLILEDLVESPNKAHIDHYDTRLNHFNSEQAKMASWTIQGRIARLAPKPLR
ncbi:hypothetical protein [Vibrio sagamiensis]|uniref:RiboL-PSP-HEPN domain-containing protein n=1 Tax=Vibrio sagamiensis NBRC 104589 TaxID=1219064 RepID=A0A511QG24_9VIBR|nr:hypothetical protein [Vibrio sagamiensis]PNQ53990.1 hypothetical protein C1141_18295 [Vibrio agarivorans]GEM76096.1 hypothetical protein VSA01S_22080 [Vibrio sagamiensis NBRC 104589]